MESLRQIRRVPGIRMGLGGHEAEMEDLGGPYRRYAGVP